MKANQFNQGITIHVVTDFKPLKNGSNTLFLRVTIDRRKKEFEILETHNSQLLK